MGKVGVVAIGRNEGERLRRCLASLAGQAAALVYVDSGSSDGSVDLARSLGANVVELDTSVPFTAARARNAGFDYLMACHADVEFVQFVDGDCEVDPDWIGRARYVLESTPEVAVVCGRRRERYRSLSPYNRLCDMEWDTAIGEAEACGGDALMRVEALRSVGGFDGALMAGEEVELCHRLRAAGNRVQRIDADMTLHDAAMLRFSQWWRRSVRTGYGMAACLHATRHSALPLWRRENRSNFVYGLFLPLAAVCLAPWTFGLSLLLLGLEVLLGLRVYRNKRRSGASPSEARLYAAFCVVGKSAQAYGQLRFLSDRVRSLRPALIEYKQPAGEAPVAYLVNQYPHASHSFIRREIAALEKQGVTVARFSIRASGVELVDPADAAEAAKTTVLLAAGVPTMLAAFLTCAITRPGLCVLGLVEAARLGRRSERGILRHLVYLAEACLLLKYLRRCRARHLHAHFGTNPATVALLVRALGGPPYSFTVHGPEEFDHPEALSIRDKIAGAVFVVAISDYGKSQLYRWCDAAHWPKIQVVRCGVDAAFLAAGPQPIADVPRMVCVGRLAEQKGQLLLLEAAAKLKEEGHTFELTLAGDGPMRPEIEEQIKCRKLNDHIHITGWLSNESVRKHMLDARVVVLPSFAEGLPVVLMEALALGRPVVTTYVAGIPELVEAGWSGWLVPAGSIDALTDALRHSLQTPVDRLEAMGRIGAERVAERHDVHTEAAKLVALFSRCK
jgi:glycosyltransferase involved in cell wall biosynthesis/GT2 family glycosyltransferase